jgi:hypothetical protein
MKQKWFIIIETKEKVKEYDLANFTSFIVLQDGS